MSDLGMEFVDGRDSLGIVIFRFHLCGYTPAH